MNNNQDISIIADKEGSRLMTILFNMMTLEQKKLVPDHIAKRITRYAEFNGYRMVFNRWYLQAKPGPLE